MHQRIFRMMAIAVVSAVVISALFASWRVVTGLLLGGLLSLLNQYMLRNSISAAFSLSSGETRPRINLAQYIFRYLIIGVTVFAAYKLNIVSLPATVAGLCSFVVALFCEAFRVFYFAIIHREEIS
jgi:hypothetical protein